MSALDGIRERATTKPAYSWPHEAQTDRDRLLAALDAVLAVTDVLDGRATTNHATAKQRYQEGDRVNAAAYQALELAQMQTSQELRAAVNDALEAS